MVGGLTLPVLGRGKVGSLQEDGSAVVEGSVLPVELSSQSTVNGLGNKSLISIVVVAEDGLVLMGHDLLLHDSGADLGKPKETNRTARIVSLSIEAPQCFDSILSRNRVDKRRKTVPPFR